MKHFIPVQLLHTAYPSQGQQQVLAPQATKQLRIFQMKCINRSGNLCDIGILRALAPNQTFEYYFDGTNANSISPQVQSNTPAQIFSSNAGSALIVQANKTFNMIGVTVSTAANGGSTFQPQYWNGSSWQNLPDVMLAATYTSTGYQLLMFSAPIDWQPGGTGVGAINSLLYTIRIVSTGVTNTPAATNIQVGKLIDFSPGVNVNSGVESEFSVDYPLHLDSNEGIIPYFSVASPYNLVSAFYSQDN